MGKERRKNAKGTTNRNFSATPITSQKGLQPCECEHFLGTISRNFKHQYGKHEATELSPGDIFLSLNVPSLGTLVADQNFALISSSANLWTNYNKSRINTLEFSREAAAAAKTHKAVDLQTRKEERQRLKEAQEFTKEAAENAISFLSFKYGGSIEERRQKFGSQPSRCPNEPILSYTSSICNNLTHSAFLLDLSKSNPPTNEPTVKQHTLILSPSPDNGSFTETNLIGATSQQSASETEYSPITPTSGFSPLHQEFPLQTTSWSLLDLQAHSQPCDLASQSSQLLPKYNMSSQHTPDTIGGVDSSIKDVIQDLFVLQQHVSVFRSENQEGLNQQVEEIAKSLTNLERSVSKPNNPLHDIRVAPDIIDYVDDGRNPDIYTRDFVELVQRGNSVMNGKQKAFKDFSKVFAKALKENFEGLDDEVDMIMADAGMEEKDGNFIEKGLQNHNGA